MLEQKSPQKAWEGRPYHKKWGILEKSSSSIEKQVDAINKIYGEMSSRFPVYEKILTQQSKLFEKIEKLEEHTKNIEDGIKKKDFEDRNQIWDNKKIVRDKDGEK